MLGLTLLVKDVVVHHLIIIVISNNFDLPWLLFFVISSGWLFLIGAIEDANVMGYYF